MQDDRIDYTSAKRVNALEIPPDLNQLSRDSRYALPPDGITASAYQAASANAPTRPVAVDQLPGVRLERAGTQRWLVVSAPADQVWPQLKDFWQGAGFNLALEDKPLGLLETDWAENRAKIPQDFIRNTIGKLVDNLYSTGERDRFRTRLETNEKGETEIYISHRGMVEVYADRDKGTTVWQPRPSDAALESEFLRRLMLKLGTPADAAQQKLAATSSVPPKARLVGSAAGSNVAIEMDDGFDRAWRRVGAALDRTGFTVQDRDRSAGVYYIRYVDGSREPTEQGLLSKWFSSNKSEAKTDRYQINVVSAGNATRVTVQAVDLSATATNQSEKIAKLLVDDLK
jgi:outer membrane protein assembly factor BamC